MLLAINDRIKGWLGIFVVVLIGLPFALWGIESYIGGASEQHAAIIDDAEITASQLDRDVSRLRQQIARETPDQLPEDNELRRNALDRIINSMVLENQADEQGYGISDPVLAANIRKLFSNQGEFVAEQYAQVLESQGMTPAMFERQYRSELRNDQMRDAILASAIVTESDARRLLELTEQVRHINWLQLNVDKLVGSVEVSEDDIQDFYQKQSARYMTPAQVSIEYVELSADSVQGIEVNESDIQARYDEYVEQQKQREERKASHILITADDERSEEMLAKTIDIRLKLKEGISFSELAKEYSEDPGSAENGGDLDWVATGQMVKEFEDALFKLGKGEVSGPVKTEFGYHLIKVDDIRSAAVDSLEEKRDEIHDQLKEETLGGMLYDLSEIMANTAYENPDSLEPVAEALEQEIKSTGLFSLAIGSGIAENEAVRKAAFSRVVLEQGENSELIELSPEHVLVLRIKEHKESSPVPIDTVRSTIEASIRITRGQEIVGEIADEIIAKLKNGDSVESVVRDGITDKGEKTIDLKTGGDVDRYFMSQVMDLPLPVGDEIVYGKVGMGSGDIAVIMLNKVEFPRQIDQARLKSTLDQFRRARAIEDFGAMLTAYKDRAKIVINEKVVSGE